VLSNLGLLEAGGPQLDPAEQREIMADVREGLERVRRIVDGLRIFSRPDDTVRDRVDLPRIVDTALALAAGELRQRARLVRAHRGTVAVEASEARLAQALLELLVNAARAIPEGRPDRHEIRVETGLDAAGRAMVIIRDTGVGLSPEQLLRVFEPFPGGPCSGADAGLGLSLCHAIVSGLGGEITVESRLGEGSTFTVSLPAAT
jgi:signal transduction histidine kinase